MKTPATAFWLTMAMMALGAATGCGSEAGPVEKARATSAALKLPNGGRLHPLGGATDSNVCVGHAWVDGVAVMQLSDCAAAYEFELGQSGELAYSLGYCVEAEPLMNQAFFVPCNGSLAQLWGYSHGRLQSELDNRYCLDVNGGNEAVGTAVGLWQCNDTPAQVFLPEGALLRFFSDAGLYLDVHYGDGPNTPPGTPLDVAYGNGTAAQYWTLDFSHGVPGHQVSIMPYYGLCAAWQFGQSYNPAQLTTCGEPGAQWLYTPNGQFQTSVVNHWCLDVNDDNRASGTPVDVAPCNGTSAQVWDFFWM